MITVENVSRRYGDFAAVDAVSFSISGGEVVGLLGHNGAGKTTIMKMLTGYLEPTEGTITINGRDISTDRQQVQHQIGYLPENCPVYPEMTVVSYLEYAASLQGVAAADRPALVREAIERTALAEKAHQPIATLSRGYRQRTGVAQAILHKPSILILDEPTNGLDPTQIQQMRELIRTLAETSTVIISTHILQEVQAVCDRVIIINNGRVAMDSRIDSIQQGGRLVVTIDSDDPATEKVLTAIAGVAGAEAFDKVLPERGTVSYALTLGDDADRRTTAAAVARAVHENGWPLSSLFFETRDLESVFAQTSAQ